MHTNLQLMSGKHDGYLLASEELSEGKETDLFYTALKGPGGLSRAPETSGKAYSEAARPRHRRAAASPPVPATPEQPDPVQPGARLSRPAPGSLPRTSSGPPPRLLGAPPAARSPTGFQFRDEPLLPARESGSQKPLSPPAARLPGRAGSSAPPAGEQPFPTCTGGTCRSAQCRKWPNPGAGEPEVRGGGGEGGGEGNGEGGGGQKGRGEGFPGSADRARRASEASAPAAGVARVRERRRWGLWEPPTGKKRGPASLSPQTRLLLVPQLSEKPLRGVQSESSPPVLERVPTPEPQPLNFGCKTKAVPTDKAFFNELTVSQKAWSWQTVNI
ncbi:unnamed protein product [Rangifer tarandus platyrhynchus]|uniref:Uncharacterized protein n=1 Tax=Rangifer tarandus platyrhynchus TaxID=3082113 RepID=A0ABN8YC53_RANTA|nr:unnamed protein product [Rangifer tarandus platyrhynchus]